jgi:hypothetical protein
MISCISVGSEKHQIFLADFVRCGEVKFRRTILVLMRWAGNVAQMGRRGMHIGYWWETQKERDHYEDQDVGGWTILK